MNNETDVKMTAYYYQLQDEFYRRREVKILEKMQNGYAYAYFYLKLMVESLATNGYLKLNNYPLTVDDLAAITEMDIDTVRSAVAVLIRLGMLQQMQDGTYFIEEVKMFIKRISMTPEAIKKRRQRAEKAAQEAAELAAIEAGKKDELPVLPVGEPSKQGKGTKCPDNVPTMSREKGTNCPDNIEIRDYNLENKYIEEETSNYSSLLSRACAPTREEVEKFIREHCSHIVDMGFFDYYEKRGWTIEGEPVRDWRALAVKWDDNMASEVERLPIDQERELWKEYKEHFGESVPVQYYGKKWKYVQLAIATGTPLKGE